MIFSIVFRPDLLLLIIVVLQQDGIVITNYDVLLLAVRDDHFHRRSRCVGKRRRKAPATCRRRCQIGKVERRDRTSLVMMVVLGGGITFLDHLLITASSALPSSRRCRSVHNMAVPLVVLAAILFSRWRS